MGWLDDVRSCVEALPPEFVLADVYAFSYDLSQGRRNRNVPDQIRKQLQVLVQENLIERVEPGRFRHVQSSTATVWPFTVGDRTTRAELCGVLGLDPHGLDRKGMHKNAKGRFSRDLLLFHEAGENPYQDRFINENEILWIGRGVAEKGDQHYDGFNRYLAEQMELGIKVHLFVRQDASSPELSYRGEFVTKDVRFVLRSQERRRVYEYDLQRSPTADERRILGTFFVHSWEAPPVPYTIVARNRASSAVRPARDRAFSARLRLLYRNRCAVCGRPTVGRSGLGAARRLDLQGAHVRSVADGGPDETNNGICLCARHHWAFDHGVFSIGRDYEIVIGRDAEYPHNQLVEGKQIELPADAVHRPHETYLEWHRENWQISA